MLLQIFGLDSNSCSTHSKFRQIQPKTVRAYRIAQTIDACLVIRAFYAWQKNRFSELGSFRLIGSKTQQATWFSLYDYLLSSKGEPDESLLMEFLHAFYDSLLRASNLSSEKIACLTDISLCLAALVPDVNQARFRPANTVTKMCATRQYSFRCILAHVVRLAAAGEDRYTRVSMPESCTNAQLESDSEEEEGEGNPLVEIVENNEDTGDEDGMRACD